MQNQSCKEKEALWRERISRWEQSGLSITKFCKKENLPLSTFNWWKKRFKDEAFEPCGFVELSGNTETRRFESKNFLLHLPGVGTL